MDRLAVRTRLRGGLDSIRRALSSQWAVSVPAVLIFVVASVVIHWDRLEAAYGFRGPGALLVAVAVSAVLTPVMFAVGWIVIRRRLQRSQVAAVVVLFIATGALRGVAFAASIIQWGDGSDLTAWALVLAMAVQGVTETTIAMVVLSTVCATVFESREAWADHIRRQTQIAAARDAGQEELALMIDRINDFVDVHVRQELRDSAAALTSTSTAVPPADALRALAGRIRELASSSVRPLSHELADQTGAPVAVSVVARDAAQRVRGPGYRRFWIAVGRDSLTQPLPVVTSALVRSVVAFSSLAADFAFGLAVAQMLWLFFGTLAILAVNQIVVTRTVVRRSPIAIGAVQIGAVVAAGLLFPVGASWATAGPLFASAWLGSVPWAALAIGSCQIGMVAWRQSRVDIAEAEATAKLLEWELDTLLERVERLRYQVSQALHADVQGGLIAVSMMLTRAADEVDQGHEDEGKICVAQAGDAIDEIVRNLDHVASRGLPVGIECGHDEVSVAGALQQIAASWRGLATVVVTIEPGCANAIDSDRGVGEAVAVVVHEAVVNAVRHAGATVVRVVVSRDVATFQVMVFSNRSRHAALREPGLGSQTIGRLTTGWELHLDTDSTTLTARFPHVAATL